MGTTQYRHRCPNCQSETASNQETEDCPECGTGMERSPNGGRAIPHPTDPRYNPPRANRLPPPTGRQRPPI
jgi:endogenous inhibitor of DNA gyrase (YacG/DUF329 family)